MALAKKQGKITDLRDRFIAFSFASADFLLEIDRTGQVVFTAGEVNGLTGYDSQDIAGTDWLHLFTSRSQGELKALLNGVQRAGRIGPVVVDFCHSKTEGKRRALVMGMTLPDSENIYLAFNATEAFFDFLAMGDYNDSQLLDEKQFETAAIKAFQSAKEKGKNLDVTFLEVDQIEEYKKTLSIDEANNFNENFKSILKEQSFEGNTASQVDDDKYAVIHDTEITPEYIENKIQELIQRSAAGEARDISFKSKTVEADMGALNEREARRALIYTINQVEKGGVDAANEDLTKGFDDYLLENAAKISRLKELVGKQAFKLNFQPIVHLPSEDICHHEALVRFGGDHEESPYELITFGEDIGIAPDVDMAILKQATGYVVRNHKKNPSMRIAVNISGQSIQSEDFFDKMLRVIEETKCSPDHLMFEITESTAINDLEVVNGYIQKLRTKGFEVCLDDFGAGSASFQYLNGLDIDCVKIDGKYITDALKSNRDEAMVRNLVRMCKDLGVTTIAEMVETQEQLDYLISIGVDKAQGYLIGKPGANTDYTPRDKS